MLGRLRIFVVLAIFCPWTVFAADASNPAVTSTEQQETENKDEAEEAVAEPFQIETDHLTEVKDKLKELHWDESENEERRELYQKLENLLASVEEKNKTMLSERQSAYKNAKENEQSTANKTLTALTTAATGIGGMELAMGLSEQKADKNADADMDAYIQTFRCTYADGKQVKAGPEEIELPGGNIPELMKLRTEYVALANDLKERKTALGMKPGIESEEILDKATMGLYDDENVGITGGAYASDVRFRRRPGKDRRRQKNIQESCYCRWCIGWCWCCWWYYWKQRYKR